MDKRDFLKTSGILIAGSVLSSVSGEGQTADVHKNWSGNYDYSTQNVHTPRTVADVQKVVKSCEHVRAVGTRHSFNGIADSKWNQISLKSLNTMELDTRSRTVTVGAGVRYGDLAPYLDTHGYALHNLASLPHISIAGARATGTHGSGSKNGNLSTAISAIEFVTPDGELATLSRDHDGDRFHGAVVDLGAIGIVTKLTVDVQPTFTVSQVVYENLPIEQLEHHLDEIFLSGYSVSLFTDWQHHRITQVWVKSRIAHGGTAPKAQADFFGAKPATVRLHPLAGHSAENCTEQLGIPGPWYERLPHFRMNFTPSSGAELQSEYFIPRDRAYQAILAVEKLRDHITPHLFVTELRTIEADDLWMSMAYHRPSLAMHFTWKPEWPEVKQVLPLIEAQLAPFNPRPHWAKLFTIAPDKIQPQYEKLAAYKELVAHYDPKGKFRNDFVRTSLYS